ncbi:hypothetical protein Clacol_003761 [Clathrus columnatus]|uniref:Phosphoacetylglucosamine mutase n=1 Tax=Clathrus columnatus TaxID=1419009 RepID=A0AAV5AA58_9AGAM|nr:hypothetical protein Clacol_003761 [Clathrus columnatus]
MSSFPTSELVKFSDLHPKPSNVTFSYGTAGFRTKASLLDSVLFRVGVLAALRSKRLDGKTIGVMVTASHNPEADNGVKLVDPRGEMLENSWETLATNLSNAETTGDFIQVVKNIINHQKIDISKTANVIIARDTRPSGPGLVAALEDGLRAMGAVARNEGVKTTPILHYLAGKKAPPLVVDCANGVGFFAAKAMGEYVNSVLPLIPHNIAINALGALNNACGADYVKTSQRLPPSLVSVLHPGQRACSFDGDADRLIYFYLDDRSQFHMLDGDKIAALVANFIAELAKGAGLDGKFEIGVVQTAYANGSSTKYLSERLPVQCVKTGVKNLHHAAEGYSIGVYFEANGHGTVLFSPSALSILETHQPSTPAQSTYLSNLIALSDLINQTVGDALSDMLLVEVILAHKGYSGLEWDSIYSDLPNRLVKVVVKDRNIFETEDAERRLTSPPGLQQRLDDIIRKYDGGRAFVRPSGTEDVVRVYAEATLRPQADGKSQTFDLEIMFIPNIFPELAFRIAGLVYDESGGDSSKRPKEFL